MKEVRALLLAAGKGTRLRPLTNVWPKCLMPIGERPLLEYWLETLHSSGVRNVLVNQHHHAEKTKKFLRRSRFDGWVKSVYEPNLLGTAGTLTANKNFFDGVTTLLVHADNWCHCKFGEFLDWHRTCRPAYCLITMMTFDSPTPQTCGIVETDEEGVVQSFHEKKKNPPGNCANGAVYLLEPEVLEWLEERPRSSDFSMDVLPHFIGRIATWHNFGIHRDIGTLPVLKQAQLDPKPAPLWPKKDTWQQQFLKHPVHQRISASLV